MKPASRLPLTALLLLLCLPIFSPLALAAADGEPAANGRETMSSDEMAFDEIEARNQLEAKRKKAETEGDFVQAEDEKLTVERRVLTKPWHKVPFNQEPFDLTPEQIETNWPKLMRGLGVPFPSVEWLRTRYERFPAFKKSYEKGRGHKFDGNYEALSREVVEVWRLFFRGDFQQAMKEGEKLGMGGQVPGKLAQAIYAIYLEPDLSHKHMLLQDVVNIEGAYNKELEEMKKLKEFQYEYALIRFNYGFALGRIGEDVPIAVAIARNYPLKIMDVIDDVQDYAPDYVLGLAMHGSFDANIVRKAGKTMAKTIGVRVSFGSRKPNQAREDFEKATSMVPDLAVLRYEYANAMLYIDKKTAIPEALVQLQRGISTRPYFAMEALDSMYAAKRKKEVEALAAYKGSFRAFERKRLAYQKKNNENLYCVTKPPFIIQ